ncbi:MAG: hypothetical protein ABI882_03595 [Acidobacteriota bacterium]
MLLVTLLALLTGSCANLARVRDESIPRLIEPLATAEFSELTSQLKGLTDMQALRATRGLIQFIDAESKDKYRTADMQLVLQRPDRIRLIIQYPITGTKIADMVSESNHFRVAVFVSNYRRFLTGTNDGDYSRWRNKLGAEGRNAMASARPFHFTEALLMRPLQLDEPRFTYGLEEALVEEPDTRQGAKRDARIQRSFYVLSEVESASTPNTAARVHRRFWFDRTNKAMFSRLQIFDNKGLLATEVHYSNFEKLSDESPVLWPSVILVSRPHDGYSARLTFSAGRFEVNPSNLMSQAFTLENSEGLPVTDLDSPATP